jgi:hypothetical protein
MSSINFHTYSSSVNEQRRKQRYEGKLRSYIVSLLKAVGVDKPMAMKKRRTHKSKDGDEILIFLSYLSKNSLLKRYEI